MQRVVESVSTQWGFIPVKAAFIHGQLVRASNTAVLSFTVLYSTLYLCLVSVAGFPYPSGVSHGRVRDLWRGTALCYTLQRPIVIGI